RSATASARAARSSAGMAGGVSMVFMVVPPGEFYRESGWKTRGRERRPSEAEAVGLEPTSGRAATCFQDRPLIRPVGFRRSAAFLLASSRPVPGAGIEPAASTFRAWRHDQQQLPRSRRLDRMGSIREGGFE